MTITEKKEQLLAELAAIQDAQERFAFVVARGRRHPGLGAPFKTDEFRVEGCLAQLWLVPDFRDGRCHFTADSDSAIMKGVAALLCDFYSGQTPEEIAGTDPAFLGRAGITQHLSPNRRNGLRRIWEQMTAFAASHARGRE